MSNVYEVEMFMGGGGDTDSIATYLVYADDEEKAEAIVVGQSAHLINTKANLIRHPGSVDELDYDGVLGDRPEEPTPEPEVILTYDTRVFVHVEDGQITSVHVDDENLTLDRGGSYLMNDGPKGPVDKAIDLAEGNEAEWPAWNFGY